MKLSIQSLHRRSPVHDCLDRMNPVWGEVQGMLVALRCAEQEAESTSKGKMALSDVSCLPRMGLKGAGVVTWLKSQGLSVPEPIYAVAPLEDEGMLARVDSQEVFLEDGPQGRVISQLQDQLSAGPSMVYQVPHHEASFLICGTGANKVLNETCGYDFQESKICLVMTQLAGVSCRLLRVHIAGIIGYRIWVDPSYSVYLWETLLEIIREHGGDVVGLNCFYLSLPAANITKG